VAGELRIGQCLDRYRIERVLGRGGGGSVYLAEADTGEEVALKVMHEHDLTGIARKRFEREADFVKSLQHPNIVRLLDFGYTRDSGLPYICFSYLEGLTVKEALRVEGPFSTRRIIRVTLEALDALEAAHAMGIIHRDIKPANVFLERRGAAEVVQILDFGLAKALEGERLETTGLTRTGYRLGTPRYMSPEMARGEPVVESSDIYSLGLVVAEMITGHPVITEDMHVAIMLEHASDEPLSLPAAIASSPLAAIVRHSLAKHADQRYRDAVEMRAALREIELPREPIRSPIVEEPEDPTVQLPRPEDVSIGSALTTEMPKPSALRDDSPTVVKAVPMRPSEEYSTMEISDAPTHAWRRPKAPVRLETPPELSLWVAIAVGVLLAVMTFILGVALIV